MFAIGFNTGGRFAITVIIRLFWLFRDPLLALIVAEYVPTSAAPGAR